MTIYLYYVLVKYFLILSTQYCGLSFLYRRIETAINDIAIRFQIYIYGQKPGIRSHTRETLSTIEIKFYDRLFYGNIRVVISIHFKSEQVINNCDQLLPDLPFHNLGVSKSVDIQVLSSSEALWDGFEIKAPKQ